ncbi:MAG: ATPase domain-containing protein [Candidatus Thermoplasmatota archaeon]|nr:ATPase domain-containing protein [Candidatus Thermoplasmatota archaeon]
MDKSDAGAYIKIVEHLLEKNSDVIDTAQINMGIARAVAEGAPLKGISIGEDMSLICKVKDLGKCKIAVAGVIRIIYDFMAAVMDPETADNSVIGPLREYAQENSVSDILEHLGDLIGEESAPSALEDKTDQEKVAAIYSACLNSYLSETKRDYEQHIKNLFSSIGTVEMDGKEITILPSAVEDFARKIAEVFNEFVELFFSLESMELDMAGEKERISKILAAYDPLPQELGITSSILFGSLATTVSTGLNTLDYLLGGGIARGESAVLRASPGWEHELFSRRFIRAGLLSGASVVVILSNMSPEDFKDQMEMVRIDVNRYEKKGKLWIIDWYSHNYKRVVGIERDGTVIRCSNDLTNVSMALDMVLGEIKDAPVKLGVLNIVSPALMRFGFEPVYEFAQAANSKFRRADVSALVLLVKKLHSMEYFHSISDIFSTTIDIERVEDRMGYEIRVSGSSVTSVSRERLSASWTKRGLVIEGKEVEAVNFSFEKGGMDLGLGGMERIGSGIPPGRTTLLQCPECEEKDLFVLSAIEEMLSQGKKVVLVLGNMLPSDFSKTFLEGKNQKGLTFVDWYSHKNEKIIGVEKRGDIYYASQDIAHLSIAIKKAVEEAGEGAFVILDMLTAILKYYELGPVVSFATTLAAHLRSNGATGIALFDSEAFDSEYSSALGFTFDGIIEIKEDKELGGEKVILMPSIRNSYSTGKKAACVIEKDKLRFEELEALIEKVMASGGGRASQEVLEALKRENTQLKRKLASFESDAATEASDAQKSRVLELETELARLREQLATDAKEIGKVLSIIDEMFESLPEEVLQNFTSSEQFELYEKIVDRYSLTRDFGEEQD